MRSFRHCFHGLLAFTFVIGSSTATRVALAANPEGPSLQITQLDHGVYFGGAPCTEADFGRLRQLGIRQVIDIRKFLIFSSARERQRARRQGLTFERIPVGFRPERNDSVRTIMRRLSTKPCGPIYFHCKLGSDRTGLIAAIYRVRHLGWDPDYTFRVWKAGQFNPRLRGLDRYYWKAVSRRH